jgi:hypothetical protein
MGTERHIAMRARMQRSFEHGFVHPDGTPVHGSVAPVPRPFGRGVPVDVPGKLITAQREIIYTKLLKVKR